MYPQPQCDLADCAYAVIISNIAKDKPVPGRCECMYVCMFVFLFVCLYVCMYVCLYVCLFVCL